MNKLSILPAALRLDAPHSEVCHLRVGWLAGLRSVTDLAKDQGRPESEDSFLKSRRWVTGSEAPSPISFELVKWQPPHQEKNL